MNQRFLLSPYACKFFNDQRLRGGREKLKISEHLIAEHVALRVSNFAETVQWYEQILGFRQVMRWRFGI